MTIYRDLSAPACPHCGHTLDSATEETGFGEAAMAGNWTVCAYRARFRGFTGDGPGLRQVTGDEFVEALGDADIIAGRDAVIGGSWRRRP